MQPLRYTGGRLDRIAKLRQDDDWVSAAFVGDDARAVLVSDDRNLVAGSTDGEQSMRAALVPLSLVRDRLPADAFTWTLLGLDDTTPVFAVDLPTDALAALPVLADTGRFVDIRKVGSLVPMADAALLA